MTTIEVHKNGVWTERDKRWLLTADEQPCPECKSGVCWITYVWDSGAANEADAELGPWCAIARHGPKQGCCFCTRNIRPGKEMVCVVPCQACQAKAVSATKVLYAKPPSSRF